MAPALPVVSHPVDRLSARYSHLEYDMRMAIAKVSLSIHEEVLAEARERAGRRELSSYVTDALRRQLQRDRLADLLAQMEREAGPIAPELLKEARELWRDPVTGRSPDA